MTEVQQPVEQFDEIRADRVCIGCGFNLYAQPVSKEEHYGLAICRCPECGTVAALQSYPTMTHWVNRFRALIAAIWVVLLLAFFAGNIGAISGMTAAACDESARYMGELMGQEHQRWEDLKLAELKALESESGQAVDQTGQAAQPIAPIDPLAALNAPGTTIVTTTNGVTTINGVPVVSSGTTAGGRWTMITDEWRDTHLDDTVQLSGGLWENVNREFLIFLIPMSIVGTLFGIFWSVALLGSSRKKAVLVPLILCVVGLAIVLAIHAPASSNSYSQNIAVGMYAPLIAPIMFAYQLLVMAFGIWIGRKVARMIVVMALPPRNRVPLSLLWTRDGLVLPSTK
jgi:hypothetical protein